MLFWELVLLIELMVGSMYIKFLSLSLCLIVLY